ncbi:hypothetical protein M407DRAFT_18891 [Tulasnella calospora MUT 4182]|uniref:Uncharacterized protein n=1 Tax=Tulasnella calospora MUT 4182 TaxID=1051891 RepID=A0A0C3QIV1_9AGAM|nr:hypothetical protein M407DRAFT_18891 [Tulasnella calospora MUT 4182]
MQGNFNTSGKTEHAVASNYPQCMGCGLSGRTVKNPCGTCERLAGGNGTSKEAGASARAAAMQSRVRSIARGTFTTDLTNKTSDPQPRSVGPVTTEADLDKLRTARAQGNFSIIFSLVIHAANGKTVANTYGQMSLLFETSETMQNILGEMVDRASQKWVKNQNCYRLETRDVELRFKGNKDIEEDELALTLSEFYGTYSNRPDRDAFIPANKVKGVAKGNYLEMPVELHIFLDRHRTGEGDSIPATQKSKRRRSQDDSDDDYEPITTKRSASGSGPLMRKFIRDSGVLGRGATRAADAMRAIRFRRVTAKIEDSETGETTVIKSQRTESGTISVSPIKLPKGEKGRSKELYDSASYVAKRILYKAPGKPVPDINKQYDFLLGDLIRLSKGQMFVKRFEIAADEHSVEPSVFCFTEGFLITVFSEDRSMAEAPAKPLLVPHGPSDNVSEVGVKGNNDGLFDARFDV